MTNPPSEKIFLKGFENPVEQAGRAFRGLLDAMSRPGTVVEVDGPAERPEGLGQAAAAVLLTLADYSTPVWLGETAGHEDIAVYLQFHSGAPVTARQGDAAFALIADPHAGFDPAAFHQGTADYPDRSTTVIVEVDRFDAPFWVHLSGPGIDGQTTFGAGRLPIGFWPALQANHARFPLGVDVFLTSGNQVAAISRSTKIEVLR